MDSTEFRCGARALWLALLLAAVPAADAANGDGLDQARAYLQAGNPASAEITLKNLLQQAPKTIDAQLLLARVQLLRGEPMQAAATLEQAERAGAPWSGLAPLRARQYLQQGEYRRLFEDVPLEGLSGEPLAEVLYCRGRGQLARRDLDAAMQAFSAAREAAPDAAFAAIGSADVLVRRGTLNAALTAAQRAVELAPGDAEAWDARALVHEAMGDGDAALADYTEALRRNPERLASRMARLQLLASLGRRDAMQADFDALEARHQPLPPYAALLKAQWLRQRGDTVRARSVLEQTADGLSRLPRDAADRDPEILLLSANVNYALDRLQNARGDLEGFLQRQPQHAGARRLLGAVLMRLNEPAAAVKVLEPAGAQLADDAPFALQLGLAYLGAGEAQKATAELERALSLSNNNPAIASELAGARFQSGQVDQALSDLSTLFASEASSADSGVPLLMMQLRAGRAQDAIATADKLVAMKPDDTALLNLSAMAHAAAGDLDGAHAAFERALALDPSLRVVHVNLTRLELRQGRAAQARDRLQTVLREHPDDTALRQELGRVLMALDQHAEARQQWEQVRAADSTALDARLGLAEIYLAQGNPARALEVATEAERIAPRSVAALSALGMAQLANGLRDLASTSFRRAAVLTNDPAQLAVLGRRQILAQAPGEAVQTLQRAMQLAPQRAADLRPTLIEALVFANRLDDAEREARILREQPQRAAVGDGLLGEVLLRRGRVTEAVQVYRTALEQHPTPGLASGAYRALRQLGDQAAALAVIEQWAPRFANDPQVRSALADAYLRQHDWARARPLWERLVTERPRDADVRVALARIYLQLDDPRALELARSAMALAPNNAAALDALGWVLVRRGEIKAGLAQLRAAQQFAVDDPEVRYHLAVALHQLGRNDEARVELNRALSGTPGFSGVDEARALLETLRKVR